MTERYDDPVYSNLAGWIPRDDGSGDETLDDWLESYHDTNANRNDPEELEKSAVRGLSQLGEVTQALTRKCECCKPERNRAELTLQME
jgi:hypothetical protein